MPTTASLSPLQVYNEVVRDLLVEGCPIAKIRESHQTACAVPRRTRRVAPGSWSHQPTQPGPCPNPPPRDMKQTST